MVQTPDISSWESESEEQEAFLRFKSSQPVFPGRKRLRNFPIRLLGTVKGQQEKLLGGNFITARKITKKTFIWFRNLIVNSLFISENEEQETPLRKFHRDHKRVVSTNPNKYGSDSRYVFSRVREGRAGCFLQEGVITTSVHGTRKGLRNFPIRLLEPSLSSRKATLWELHHGRQGWQGLIL